MPLDLIWSIYDQHFITIPDGNIATHKQIKEYYETCLQKSTYKDNRCIDSVYKHIPIID